MGIMNKMKTVDLGTIRPNLGSAPTYLYFRLSISDGVFKNGQDLNIEGYNNAGYVSYTTDLPNITYTVRQNGYIYFRNDGCSTIDQFKQTLQGVILTYETIDSVEEEIMSRTSNLWDEQWEVGAIDTSLGVPTYASNAIRSKNFCECTGGSEYFLKCGDNTGRYWLAIIFYDTEQRYVYGVYGSNNVVTAPSNARYFKITTNVGTFVYGSTYKHDIAIIKGTTGVYEPFVIPTVIMNKMKTVRLRDMTWTMAVASGRYIFRCTPPDGKISDSPNSPIRAVCDGYVAVTTNKTWVDKDMAYTQSTGSSVIAFINNSFTNVSVFLASEGDKILTYETADSVEE